MTKNSNSNNDYMLTEDRMYLSFTPSVGMLIRNHFNKEIKKIAFDNDDIDLVTFEEDRHFFTSYYRIKIEGPGWKLKALLDWMEGFMKDE